MYVAKYAADKPKDCRFCYWGTDKGKCRLGPNNCYYMTKVIEKKKDICDDCPYHRQGHPCIGWCTRRIMGTFPMEETEETHADKISG